MLVIVGLFFKYNGIIEMVKTEKEEKKHCVTDVLSSILSI